MAEKQVLFLCTGNYYRSRFAEALFNHLAREAAVGWVADSCGLNIGALGPDTPGPMSRRALERLKARGVALDAPPRWFRQVTEADLVASELVVALKELEHRPMLTRLHPEWADRVRYWHVHDVDQTPPEEALAEIEQLVRGLVEELRSP